VPRDSFVTTARAERQFCHNRACRETLLSLPSLPGGSFVTTEFDGRHCCHCRACRETLLSLPSLPGGSFVTTEFDGRHFCHCRACREEVLSLPSLPRGSFVTTKLAERQFCQYRLPRGSFVTVALAERRFVNTARGVSSLIYQACREAVLSLIINGSDGLEIHQVTPKYFQLNDKGSQIPTHLSKTAVLDSKKTALSHDFLWVSCYEILNPHTGTYAVPCVEAGFNDMDSWKHSMQVFCTGSLALQDVTGCLDILVRAQRGVLHRAFWSSADA
jgi:hypothetical protein